MKIKDKVYKYEIKLDFKNDKIQQSQLEFSVIGVNKNRLCIDNDYFTSIKYKKQYKSDKDDLFNEICIIDWTNDSYFDCIYGTLYTSTTSEKIAYKRIKKALEKHINKKYGRYCNAITFLEKIKI